MRKELYIYACSEIAKDGKSPFGAFQILCIALFSSFIAVLGDVAFGVIVTALYLGLSFLTFIDKDVRSKHMMLKVLSVLDVTVLFIYLFSIVFPDYALVLWSITVGIVIFVIYEIIVVVKLKKRLYSMPLNNKNAILTVSVPILLLFSLGTRILFKNQNSHFFLLIIVTILCSCAISGCLASFQKLIVYLIIRNKV